MNKIIVNTVKNIASPKLVINFAIGVAKSDIKNVDINLYPTMSPFIISLLNTFSAIAKNPIKQMNNIIHFKFFIIKYFILKTFYYKLKVILPQTIGQQPSDVQNQLIGVPNIVEHPDRAMMTLADASRVCNREIIDDCNQLICFLSHTSKTLHNAVQYAEEGHKVITVFYLD